MFQVSGDLSILTREALSPGGYYSRHPEQDKHKQRSKEGKSLWRDTKYCKNVEAGL